eukprot:9390615-Alexandrium_andersonii.AAC.1
MAPGSENPRRDALLRAPPSHDVRGSFASLRRQGAVEEIELSSQENNEGPATEPSRDEPPPSLMEIEAELSEQLDGKKGSSEGHHDQPAASEGQEGGSTKGTAEAGVSQTLANTATDHTSSMTTYQDVQASGLFWRKHTDESIPAAQASPVLGRMDSQAFGRGFDECLKETSEELSKIWATDRQRW